MSPSNSKPSICAFLAFVVWEEIPAYTTRCASDILDSYTAALMRVGSPPNPASEFNSELQIPDDLGLERVDRNAGGAGITGTRGLRDRSGFVETARPGTTPPRDVNKCLGAYLPDRDRVSVCTLALDGLRC